MDYSSPSWLKWRTLTPHPHPPSMKFCSMTRASELRGTLSSIYGIPAGILLVHHGTKIIVGDRPANLLQGDFIRVQLALPGGKRSDHAGCSSGPQPPTSCDLSPYSISPIRKTITPSCKIHTPRARTPGAPSPPKESKIPGKEERPATTGHCSMEMRAGFEKPCLRASSFTPRWYITHRKRNRTAHTEHGNAPVHKPPRLSLRVTDDSPDRTHASTMLQSQWGMLSRTARSFSMFKHRKEATLVVRRRLSQHIKHSDQVAGLAAAPSGTPQTTAEPPDRPNDPAPTLALSKLLTKTYASPPPQKTYRSFRRLRTRTKPVSRSYAKPQAEKKPLEP